MRKAFVLCPVLLLAALMSGCGGIAIIPSTMLRVTRDIAAGEVIQEGDLKTVGFAKRLAYHGDWGWADADDRPNVIGHKSRIAMDKGWPFRMSEIER